MTAPFGPSFFPPLGPAFGSAGPVDPTGWDRCVLNGQVVPGFSRVTGEVKLKIDRKPKPGANGANPTSHGMDPQPIRLEILTVSDEDRETLAGIVGPLIPQPNQVPKPVSIDHPSLRIINVSAVQIVGAGALVPDGPMRAKMQLEMLHWLPPGSKVATATPKGAPQRNVKNKRAGAKTNPPPTQQAGVAGPPAGLNFTPA